MTEGKDAVDVLNLINCFDGYGDSNSLQFFLKNCDAVMKIVKNTQKDQLANLIFGTKLTGKAQEVTQYKTFQDWTEIKDYLLEQFTDKRPPSHFLTQIMNIRQNFREEVKNYGDRLKLLYNKYKETCHLNYAENEAKVLIENLDSLIVDIFRKGILDEKTQIRIIAEGSQDLDKVISLAIEMELENSDKNKFTGTRHIGFVRQNNNKFFNQNNTFCMFCNINTHITSECRKLRRHEQQQINGNSNYSGYQNVTHRNENTYNNPNHRNNFSRFQGNRNFNHSNNGYANYPGRNFNPNHHNNRSRNAEFSNNFTSNFRPHNPSGSSDFPSNHNRNFGQNQHNFNNNAQRNTGRSQQVHTITSQNTDLPPTGFSNQTDSFYNNNSGNDQGASPANSQANASS